MPLEDETQEQLIVRMRSLGDSLAGEGIVEDDLMQGNFRWANLFFLERTGYTADQLEKLTIMSLMPERFHDELRERLGGKRSKYFVVPIKSARGDVTWWFAHDVEEVYPLHWSQARYLTTTEQTGQFCDLMVLLSEVTNASGELFKDHEEVHDWVRGEIARLDVNDTELRRELTAVKNQMTALSRQVMQATAASRDAANYGLRTSQELKTLTESHKGLEARLTTEILRLIGSDEFYEKQLEGFKKQLTAATAHATNSIQAAAKDVGKTMTSKVSFPVGVLSGLAVIVNYVINHPELIVKLLRLEG